MTRQPVEAWSNVVNAQFLSDDHQPIFEEWGVSFFFFFSIFSSLLSELPFFGDSKFCNAVCRVSESFNESGRGA
jgi:hypothetical protein